MNVAIHRRTLIYIFLLALSARLAFVFTMKEGFYFFDSVRYSTAAVNLLANGGFGEGYTRAPVYPVFLAGIYALFGEKILAVRIAESVLGAALAVLIAVLAGRIAGAKVGVLAGLLWSVYPMAVFIAGLVYPETVATTLLACAVLCMVTTAEQELTPKRVLMGGALFGLAALTKPIVLATIGVTTLWLIYWGRARRLSLAALFVAAAALPLAPWTARNFFVHGGLVIVEPRLVKNLPWIGEFPAQGANGGPATKTEAIAQRPGEFAVHFAREFAHFWELYPQRVQMSRPAFREQMRERDPRIVRDTGLRTDWTRLVSLLSVGPIFLFALIGAGMMWLRREQRQAFSLLALTILSFAVGYSFFYAKTRYRIPVEPYIVIMSAYGLNRVLQSFKPFNGRGKVAAEARS